LISALSIELDGQQGPLFEQLSLTLNLGDRVGLLGHNGSGKSSLLRLLSGALLPATGRIARAAACRLAHVEQHLPEALQQCSVRDVLTGALADPDGEWWRVDAMLAELELPYELAEQSVGTLSGGQHSRVLLGRALLQQPNLLLLDEPSNHLDLPALLWLEAFLKRWRGGLILVSHDQRLLDVVTERSWILRDRRLYAFDLPCSAARQALQDADMAARLRNAAEQREIDRIDASSQRLANWGRTYDNEDLARKAKVMQTRADRLREQQTFVSEGTPWRLRLSGRASPAKSLLQSDGLGVRAAASAPLLFSADHLHLAPGDKVALLGGNGSGKTSLLRRCWQALAQPGDAEMRWHAGASYGYYDQSLEQLNGEASLIDALREFCQIDEMSRRRALIGAGFAYPRHGQRVASLSGGERSRLLLLALSLASYHMLMLDEPTNHLDLEGKIELIEALQGFEGALLLVSHDRQLVEACCDRFWVIRQGRLEQWLDAQGAYARLSD
jgi:heme-transporting ATPase